MVSMKYMLIVGARCDHRCSTVYQEAFARGTASADERLAANLGRQTIRQIL